METFKQNWRVSKKDTDRMIDEGISREQLMKEKKEKIDAYMKEHQLLEDETTNE